MASLTTVNHLSNQVYDLTLSDASKHADTIGITAYHPVYTEDRGWVVASELREGEVVRTEHGPAIVTELVRQPGVFRVYNMTVEADHVYYVGDLTALVHNACSSTSGNNSAASLGKAMHKMWDFGEGFVKEDVLPSGKRIDAIDFVNNIIKELKPNNARAIARGESQLAKNAEELFDVLGIKFETVLETYG